MGHRLDKLALMCIRASLVWIYKRSQTRDALSQFALQRYHEFGDTQRE